MLTARRTKGFAHIQTLTVDHPIVTAKMIPRGDRLAVGCDDGTVYIVSTEHMVLESTPARTILFRFKPMMTEIVGFGFSFTSYHGMHVCEPIRMCMPISAVAQVDEDLGSVLNPDLLGVSAGLI